MVLQLPRPRRHYGKVQGCAALIDRRVSRDLGNAEGTRKLLFATDLCHNLILYVINDAILTIQSVINPKDHNLTTFELKDDLYPAGFSNRAPKMAPRAARKSATPAPVDFGRMCYASLG